MKYFKKQKLSKFLNRIRKIPSSYGYLVTHEPEISCIEWLIASYEGRAGNPKEYLKSLMKTTNTVYRDYEVEMKTHNIRPVPKVVFLERRLREINFLYNWIYYNKITGF